MSVLSDTGFERDRLVEIKTKVDAAFVDALGAVNTAPDSVVGQMSGIYSASLDDLNEALQNYYDAMYVSSASGVALDGAVQYVGMTRIPASPTVVTACCYGTDGTVIQLGSLARTLDDVQYYAPEAGLITRSRALDVHLQVTTVVNSGDYQVIVNGESFVYSADSATTADEIAEGVAALIIVDNVVATSDSDTVRIRAEDGKTYFKLSQSSKFTVAKLGSAVIFAGLESGAHVVPVGSLVYIDSVITGFDEITNLAQAETGRDIETDEELRQRHAQGGFNINGKATVRAIRAAILSNVDGVTYCAVYENDTDATDGNGLPPHSFESVVVGGSNKDIAEEIYDVKPAGIKPHGSTSVQVIDDNGDALTVKFSRTTSKLIWVKVTIQAYDNELDLPSTYIDDIKQAVVSYGVTIGIGRDVITQRLYCPIYTVNGIAQVLVEIAATDTLAETPSYNTNNIVIGRAELASFDVALVSVIVP